MLTSIVTFGDAAQGRIQTHIERNAAALEFWQHHCAVNRAAMRLEIMLLPKFSRFAPD